MAVKDLIICFFADSPLLNSKLKQLKRDYILFTPNVVNRQYKQFVADAGGSVLGIFGKAMKAGDTLGRVALIGFSEGCQGVSAVLDCPDASAIDVVIAVDGIHRQFSDPIGLTLNPALLANYIAFAKLAAAQPPSINPNGKLMIVTHSSIGASSLPKGMASTTQTAGAIYQEITRNPPQMIETQNCDLCPAGIHMLNLSAIRWPNSSLPVGTKMTGATITDQGWTTIRPTAPESGNLPPATFSWYGMSDGWIDQRIVNNFYIFGWGYDTPNKTKDPTGNRDHVFQAQMVLPHVVAEMLVNRWNPQCTPGPGGPSTSGFDGASCPAVGNGQGYYDQQAKPLQPDTSLQFPILIEDCGVPPPGKTIIGRPGDPCWTGENDGSNFASFIVGLGAATVGAVAGYYTGKYLVKTMRRW